MTTFVIIIILLAYVFSSSFRKIFEWIYYELAAFWVSHRTWFVIIFLALWLIPTISLLIAGSYANAFPSAVVFVLLFPVWIILLVANGLKNLRGLIQNPGTTVVRSSRGFISVFISAVLIIAVVNIAVGLWSPDTKGAINERFADSKTWTANFYKKGSAHSERNAGVRGRVKSATEVYDDFNKPIGELIPAGRIVMVLKNIQSKPATENREALLSVMLPNEHGNFVDGSVVWMPALKIEFISNEEQENSVSVSKNIPGESWRMCWRENPVPECWNVEVKMIGSRIFIKGNASTWFRFEGEQTTENTHYVGGWKDSQSNGSFCLDFDPTFTTATGWYKYPNGPEIKIWLRKN